MSKPKYENTWYAIMATMIYLIGGVPGMRKSTILGRSFLAQKPLYNHYSTDDIRASAMQVSASLSHTPEGIRNPYPGELRDGVDTLGWLGTLGLINFLSYKSKEALIEGIHLPPAGVRNLEIQNPNLNIRAAFIGYRKKMEFQPPEWTPELESLFEKATGKDCLEFAKKYNWSYQNITPWGDLEEAERIKKAVGTIRDSGSENFKYFDLIDYIPEERRSGEIAIHRLEDNLNVALDIRSFLLQSE